MRRHPAGDVDVPVTDFQPLQQQQALNELVLLTVRLLVQAAVIGLGLFLFLVALGLSTVQDGSAEALIDHEPDRSAVFGVPVALLFKACYRSLIDGGGGADLSPPRPR